MGLCLIPCLYAWFNIFSNWDPYGPDSTSNIRVAVTSEDEGYELLGLKLNIGSMVLDGLKSNHQMGWDFVDSREEALEGVPLRQILRRPDRSLGLHRGLCQHSGHGPAASPDPVL